MSVNTFTEGDAVGLNANSADPTQFFDEGCSRATATDTFFNADYIAVLGGNTVRRDTSLPLDTSLLILSLDSFHLQVLTGVEVTEVVRFCGVYDTSVGGTTPFPGVTCKSYNPIPISYSWCSVFILLCGSFSLVLDPWMKISIPVFPSLSSPSPLSFYCCTASPTTTLTENSMRYQPNLH